MHTRLINALFLLTTAAPLSAQAPLPQPARSQIEAQLNLQMQATNNHDTDAYLRTYWHNPDLVFAVFGDVIHGYDALRTAQLQWWRNGTSDATYTTRTPAEFHPLAPDLVLTTQSMHAHRTGPDGKPSEGDFVISSLWRNLPQGWQVIYAHESWAK